MAVLDNIKQAVSALFAGEKTGGGLAHGSRTQLGRKNKRAQLEAFDEVPPFFRVVSKIAWDFAAVDWTYIDRETGEPFEDDHPLVQSLRDPNPKLNVRQFRALSMQHRDIIGEWIHVLIPEETSDGQAVLTFWPIPPTDVDETRDGTAWHIDHNDVRVKVPKDAVIHEKMPDVSDPYGRGTGYGSVLSDELQIVEQSSEFVKNQFANQARPDTIITLEGASGDVIDKFKNMWSQKYGGVQNTGKPMVTNGANGMGVETLTPPIKDTKVQELKKMSATEVRQTFGVPPSIMGDLENSNRSSIHTEKSIYADNVLNPRLEQWSTMVEERIAPLFDVSVRANFDSPKPEEREFQLEVFKEAPAKTFTRNEWRNLADQPPRGDVDVYLGPAPPKIEATDAGEVDTEDQQKQMNTECDCGSKGKVYELEIETKEPNEIPQAAREIANRLEADQIETELTEEYEGSVEAAAADEIGVLNLNREEIFTVLNPLVEDHVQNFSSKRIVQINDTTRDQIRTVLAEGIVEGKNPRDIADDVGAYVDDIIPNRGEVIARTEMLRSENWSKYQTQKASGLFNDREWIATLDGRVRTEHLTLNSRRVGYEETFKVAGAEAEYPGGFGVPELDIQCRCTTAPAPDELFRLDRNIPMAKVDSTDEFRKAYWKSFDKSLSDREDSFQDVTERVLTDQINEHIIPAIESELD